MATATNVGRVTQVIGSTFDAEFSEDALPPIYNAVKIESEYKGVKLNLTGEIQQHLGGGRVRCVALGSTDGMVRGQDCVDTGAPVSVPVGERDAGTRVQPPRGSRSTDAAMSARRIGGPSIVKLPRSANYPPAPSYSRRVSRSSTC